MDTDFEVTPHASRGSNLAMDRLRSCIERIERIADERKALGSDIRDIFQELKSSGFEPKVVRELLRLRRLDPDDLEEREALLDVYRNGMGM